MPKKPEALREIPASARTVIVACKVPNGIWLQTQTTQTRMEPTQAGPKETTYNVFTGKKHYINGPAYPNGTLPKGFPDRPDMRSGYALTYGIPVDDWNLWAKQNEKSLFFHPEDGGFGAIFAAATIEEVQSIAREHALYLTGLEPLSTDEDASGRLLDRRAPKPLNSQLLRVATEPHPNG